GVPQEVGLRRYPRTRSGSYRRGKFPKSNGLLVARVLLFHKVGARGTHEAVRVCHPSVCSFVSNGHSQWLGENGLRSLASSCDLCCSRARPRTEHSPDNKWIRTGRRANHHTASVASREYHSCG